MRNCVILLLFVLGIFEGFAQDTIYMKSNEVVVAKILEISKNDVKYKKYSNIEGPDYTTLKVQIHRIIFLNGNVEYYQDNTSPKKKTKKNRMYPAQLIVHAGSSISTLSGDVENAKFKASFTGGIGFEIPIDTMKNNFIEFTSLYEVKGAKYSDSAFVYNDKYKATDVNQSNEYFTIAMAYKRYIDKKNRFYAKLGVYAGFLTVVSISGNLYDPTNDSSEKFDTERTSSYTNFDLGGTVGVGISLPMGKGKHLSYFISEIRYNHGFSSIYDDQSGNYKEFNSNFLVLVGIKFLL